MDVEADADAGSEGRVGKEVSRGDTPRLEMSNGRGRKQEMWTKTALAHSLALSSPMRPPARLYANRNPWLARSLARSGEEGRKVLKQGKECPRHWRGRPRPPTSLRRREGGREGAYILLLQPPPPPPLLLTLSSLSKEGKWRRQKIIYYSGDDDGDGAADRLFLLPLPRLAARRSGGERAAS